MIDKFHGGSISEEETNKAEKPQAPVQPEPQLKSLPDEPLPAQPAVAPAPVMASQPPAAPETAPVVAPVPEPQIQAAPVEPVAAAATVMQSAPSEPLPVVDDAQNLRDQQEEDQNTEAAFEAAMQLIAAGQGVEQILGGGDFANMPEHVKQQLRARLQQVAVQREMQQAEMARQTREKGMAAKAVSKLFSLGMMSGIISKGTMDKINALFTQQPHLQQQIQMTGQALLKAGAAPDIEFAKSTVQIAGRAAGTPTIEKQQQQQL